jgi:hypothetical protein
MDITIPRAPLPHDDPAASPAFCRALRGSEIRGGAEPGGLPGSTVAPSGPCPEHHDA